MDNGWIKIHRKLLDWEWFDNPSMLKVWLWLLFSANHEDKRWQGRLIKRGQKLTSIRHISESLRMGKDTVLKSLRKLKKTGEIDYKGDRQNGTLITIMKYNEYQVVDDSRVSDIGTQVGTRIGTQVGTQLSTQVGTQAGTKQELKELKKNNTLSLSLSQEKGEKQRESYLEQAFEDEIFMQSLQMLTKLDRAKAKQAITDAEVAFNADGNYPKDYGNYRMRVRQYVQTHVKEYKQTDNGNTNINRQPPGTTAQLLRGQLEQFFIDQSGI